MSTVKRIVLDVLKPHQPNSLEFAQRIVESEPGCRVHLDVEAVDEKTESIMLEIEGDDLHYDNIADAISIMGASVHSIDQVNVVGDDLQQQSAATTDSTDA